jgi:hypothetical protein
MFRKCWTLLLVMLLASLTLGCSGGGERGKNKNKDRPASSETSEKK